MKTIIIFCFMTLLFACQETSTKTTTQKKGSSSYLSAEDYEKNYQELKEYLNSTSGYDLIGYQERFDSVLGKKIYQYQLVDRSNNANIFASHWVTFPLQEVMLSDEFESNKKLGVHHTKAPKQPFIIIENGSYLSSQKIRSKEFAQYRFPKNTEVICYFNSVFTEDMAQRGSYKSKLIQIEENLKKTASLSEVRSFTFKRRFNQSSKTEGVIFQLTKTQPKRNIEAITLVDGAQYIKPQYRTFDKKEIGFNPIKIRVNKRIWVNDADFIEEEDGIMNFTEYSREGKNGDIIEFYGENGEYKVIQFTEKHP